EGVGESLVQHRGVVVEGPGVGAEEIRHHHPPATLPNGLGVPERAHQQSDGGNDPDEGDEPDGDVDRGAGRGERLPRVFGLPAGTGLFDPGGFDSSRHRVASCSWNRLMLMMRMGVTSTSSTTANAEPTPE